MGSPAEVRNALEKLNDDELPQIAAQLNVTFDAAIQKIQDGSARRRAKRLALLREANIVALAYVLGIALDDPPEAFRRTRSTTRNAKPASVGEAKEPGSTPRISRNAKKFGDWIEAEHLGEGGQAYTYLVQRKGSVDEERYVLKQIKNAKRAGRATAEIEACMRLDHPNVLKVIDFDVDLKRPFMVTEYCEGGTLAALNLDIRPLLDRLRMFRMICAGVEHAHGLGVVHRDIKPENIYLRSDGCTPVVGDFGICYLAEGPRHTDTNEAVGARYYMAPELEDGRAEQVDRRCDVYSLGKLLYWMLSGRMFAREKHREPMHDLSRSLDPAARSFIYEVFDRTIAVSPGSRFESVADLIDHLDSVIRRIEAQAHPLDLNMAHRCAWCGVGTYNSQVLYHPETLVTRPESVRDFGFQSVGQPQWIILACDHCGHVELFRPDRAQKKKLWKMP
ncbi:MAG: serine/threonine-protein kinase [Planctomycetota bacterium]